MTKTLFTAAAVAALVSFGTLAKAEDFTATPLQHGAPRDLPGETLIPGAQLAVDTINQVTQPILQPILAPGEAAPAAAATAPVAHHHHWHHHLAAHGTWHHRHHFAARKATHKAA